LPVKLVALIVLIRPELVDKVKLSVIHVCPDLLLVMMVLLARLVPQTVIHVISKLLIVLPHVKLMDVSMDFITIKMLLLVLSALVPTLIVVLDLQD